MENNQSVKVSITSDDLNIACAVAARAQANPATRSTKTTDVIAVMAVYKGIGSFWGGSMAPIDFAGDKIVIKRCPSIQGHQIPPMVPIGGGLDPVNFLVFVHVGEDNQADIVGYGRAGNLAKVAEDGMVDVRHLKSPDSMLRFLKMQAIDTMTASIEKDKV